MPIINTTINTNLGNKTFMLSLLPSKLVTRDLNSRQFSSEVRQHLGFSVRRPTAL